MRRKEKREKGVLRNGADKDADNTIQTPIPTAPSAVHVPVCLSTNWDLLFTENMERIINIWSMK